ncbi:MAG: hypothetical protein FWH23_02460 [Bacteroidales bacterium]|nr:hypothetical protein [Bacteroidales bacterium]
MPSVDSLTISDSLVTNKSCTSALFNISLCRCLPKRTGACEAPACAIIACISERNLLWNSCLIFSCVLDKEVVFAGLNKLVYLAFANLILYLSGLPLTLSPNLNGIGDFNTVM